MNILKKLGAGGLPAQPGAKDHPIVLQENAGLMWSAAPIGPKPVSGDEAQVLLSALDFGGFTDWREPTVEELFAAHDRSRCDPAIDTDYFTCPAGWYRTSTVAAWSSADAWFVYSYSGGTDYGVRGNRAWLRVCRSVSPVAAGQ